MHQNSYGEIDHPVATVGAQCNAYSAVFMLSAMLALGGPTRERERRGEAESESGISALMSPSLRL